MINLILSLVLLLAVGGCAQTAKIDVKQQDWDKAMAILTCPSEGSQHDGGLQPRIDSPTPLRPGEIRCIQVYAEKPENRSGVAMQQGQAYRFAMAPLNFWYDRRVDAHPIEGWGDDQSPWMKIIHWVGKKRARSPDHDLMVLMGAVSGKPHRLFAFNEYAGLVDPKAEKISGTFVAPASGELILFANDVECYYENNNGYLVLRLQIQKPIISCVESEDP